MAAEEVGFTAAEEVADFMGVAAEVFTAEGEAGSTAVEALAAEASIPVADSAEGLRRLLQVTALDATAAVR